MTRWTRIDQHDPSTLPEHPGVYLVSSVWVSSGAFMDESGVECLEVECLNRKTMLAEYTLEEWEDGELVCLHGWRYKNGNHDGDADPEYTPITPTAFGGDWIEAWAKVPVYPGEHMMDSMIIDLAQSEIDKYTGYDRTDDPCA